MRQFYFANNFSKSKRLSDEEIMRRFNATKLFVEPEYTNQDKIFLNYEGENIPIKFFKRPINEVLTEEFTVAMSPSDFYDKYSEIGVCTVHVFGKKSEDISYEDVINSLPEELLEKVTSFCVVNNVSLNGCNKYLGKVENAGANVAFVKCYRDKIKIDYIDDKKLENLSKRIKVFIFDEGENKHYLAPKESLYDMKNKSYLFGFDRNGEKILINLDEYEIIDDVEMLHTYSFPGFFKPSMYEIFSQIPENIVEQVDAVEIIWHPYVAEDFNRNLEAFNDSFHTSVVRLYRKKVK